jgi:hypothetical protein
VWLATASLADRVAVRSASCPWGWSLLAGDDPAGDDPAGDGDLTAS